jgi:hypothetical protein
MKLSKQVLTLLLCCLLVRFTAQAESFGPTGQSNEQPPTTPVQHSPQELQQLVAPIALYPDALVAQILAASTYPSEIVEADRWMQSHSNLKGEELAKEVDKQPWDPSVKALTQFPSVLENMDKNLSWTSSLGDAYANQQQDVTDAVQVMRQQAHKAGHLNSNEQEKVTPLSSNRPIPKWSTCRRTILGSSTVSRSSHIQAGIPCLGSSWPERGLDLESASGSASSEDLGGVGITGVATGMAIA